MKHYKVENTMKNEKCRCHDLISILRNYDSYFSRMLSFSQEKKQTTANGKHYHFIPARSQKVLMNQFEALIPMFKNPRPRFIDCGCGIGNIIMLANQVGYACSGIEFDKDTCDIAKSIVGYNSTIYKGDITRHKYYNQYDLIYFYVPIRNISKMEMFIRKVIKHSKLGAVLYSYGGSYHSYMSKDGRLKEIKLKHDVGSTAFKKVKE